LVGFHNKGDSTFNLTAVGAALHSPFDYNYHIQNFTYREVSSIVGGGEEASVEYQFTPDKSLEPLEFHLSASLYYNDTGSGKLFRSTFVNQTIELIEKSSGFDAKTIFTYILAFAGLGLAGYIGINISGSLNRNSSTPERGTRGSAPTASQAAAAKASWETPVYKPKPKAGAFGRKSKKASKGKGEGEGSDAPSSDSATASSE